MCADVSTLCVVHWWMKYIEGWCVGETIFPVSTWKGAVVVGLLGLSWSLRVGCRWKAIQVSDVCESIQPERCSADTSNEAHWRPSLSVWLLSIGVFSARQSPCTYSGTILSVCCHPLCASVGSSLAVGCRVIDCCSAQLQTTLCSEKNTHSHFLSYLHVWCVDLNKKLQWIYPRNGRFWQCKN